MIWYFLEDKKFLGLYFKGGPNGIYISYFMGGGANCVYGLKGKILSSDKKILQKGIT